MPAAGQIRYFAVSADPFFRIGDLSKVTDIKEVIAGANKLTDEQAFADLDAVLAWAEKNKRANTAKLGLTAIAAAAAWCGCTSHTRRR